MCARLSLAGHPHTSTLPTVTTQFDLPLDELKTYLPERTEPADFDAFWADTLSDARAARQPARFRPFDAGLTEVEVNDVTFSGFAGQPIRGWLLLPRGRTGRLPAIVDYVGYGGGRGLPYRWLVRPAAGYAQFVMDTRGQGSVWSAGATADIESDGSGPQVPGFVTRGILDPRSYYYRRLFTDVALAIDAARDHPAVDPERIVVSGGSQGGAMALAAAALEPSIRGAIIDVPFLSHPRRALEVVDTEPYAELTRYLAVHRARVDDVFRTLSYVDGLNFAARATPSALFSVGLMDDICPPSTVFAAYNHYAGPKEIRVWPYSGHEAGEGDHMAHQLRFIRALVGTDEASEAAATAPA
jgi:cephalosporin-C deacetylase